jgi:hypothetical protein
MIDDRCREMSTVDRRNMLNKEISAMYIQFRNDRKRYLQEYGVNSGDCGEMEVIERGIGISESETMNGSDDGKQSPVASNGSNGSNGSNDDNDVDDINDNNIPTNIDFNGSDEDVESTDPANSTSNRKVISPIPINELLSDMPTVIAESEHYTLTDFITTLKKYIIKGKLYEQVGIKSKLQLAKAKVLIHSTFQLDRYNGVKYTYAVPDKITLIGNNVKSTYPIDLQKVLELFSGVTRFRLTASQVEKYDQNRSVNGNGYNIFVHKLKTMRYRRHDYYRLTISADTVKIPVNG